MVEYRIDEVGNRYGRLLVIRYAGKLGGTTAWECLCDCGNTKIVRGTQLRCKGTQSCGCLHKDKLRERQTKYNVPRRLYGIWYNMIERCENPSHNYYRNYGGRGITVCEEWHNPYNFFEWAIAHGYEKYLTIDRMNYNGNYEPSNCRWVTLKEQQNNKSTNRYETINGETKTVQEWIDYYGVTNGMVWSRLMRGWSFEDALLKPSQKKYRGLKVLCIDTGEVFDSSRKAGDKYGVTAAAIRAAIYDKSSVCCGMKWKYFDA